MTRFYSVLLVFCLLGTISTASATDAVLLKPHPAEVIRQGYVLGKRTVPTGERVKVVKVQGESVDVETKDGSPLTVPLKDLRMLSNARPVAAVPNVIPESSPRPKPVFHSSLDEPTVPASKRERGEEPEPTASAPATQPKSTYHSPLDDPAAPAPGSERRKVEVRCGHITKAGKPCKRMTDSPNGLCWQHGGN